MKDKTKKILLAVGGIGVGVVVVSTGGAILGGAVIGIMARTGAFNTIPQISKEGLKLISSKGYIAGNLIRGAICTAVGTKLSYDSSKKLGEEVQKKERW